MKHEGADKVIKSTGEIILAAGTVGTTKLLLLSGVGPKAHLQELKVNLQCVDWLYRQNIVKIFDLFVSLYGGD